jgi:AbiV family abortive infection protein
MANAKSLIEEASFLFRSGFHARAYTLSHIAREEVAKITMLYSTGLRMLGGLPVDWGKLHKRLRDHKSKLTNDAYNTFMNLPEATRTLDLEKMVASSSVQNEWKNDSLYITLKGSSFKMPSEMIAPEKAKNTITLAAFSYKTTEEYLSDGGKLAERDAKVLKEIFSSFNPEKLGRNDAIAILKKLHKLIHTKNKSQKKSGRSD